MVVLFRSLLSASTRTTSSTFFSGEDIPRHQHVKPITTRNVSAWLATMTSLFVWPRPCPCLGAYLVNANVAECNDVKHEKRSHGSREV